MKIINLRNRLLFYINSLLSSLLPVKKHRVLFISFYGKSYSDNPKSISEQLYSEYGDDYEFIWILNKEADTTYLPDYIKRCSYNSVRMFYYLATSKVWISNFTLPKICYKKKNQYYINTWHGDCGFKKILLDVPKKTQYLFETKNMDLFLSGSDFSEKFCRSAFGYNGEILKAGSPRNDIFFSDVSKYNYIIRQRYNIPVSNKILIFAPTFRDEYKNNPQKVSLKLSTLVDVLNTSTQDQWTILVRSHIANAKCGFDTHYNNNIISVTDYPNMNELLSISDILLTDYSSSAGDFAISGKLVLLLQDDIDSFESKDREFYFKMSDTPFHSFSTADSLYEFIKNNDVYNSTENSKAITEFYRMVDKGIASHMVVNKINDICL